MIVIFLYEKLTHFRDSSNSVEKNPYGIYPSSKLYSKNGIRRAMTL